MQISLKSPGLFKGVLLSGTNQTIKIDYQRQNNIGFRPMETVTFKGHQTYLLRKSDSNISTDIDNIHERIIPRTICNVFTKLQIRFMRADGCGCLGFSKIYLFCEFRGSSVNKKLASLNEIGTPTIFGNYSEPEESTCNPSIFPCSSRSHKRNAKIEHPEWCIVELQKLGYMIYIGYIWYKLFFHSRCETGTVRIYDTKIARII